MPRFEIDFLYDIEQECKFIDEAFINISYTNFIGDEILTRAVTRSLEVIGEAVKNLLIKQERNIRSFVGKKLQVYVTN